MNRFLSIWIRAVGIVNVSIKGLKRRKLIFLSVWFSGRLERAIHIQRTRQEHISLRCTRRRSSSSLSISQVHFKGRSCPFVLSFEGRSFLFGRPEHPSLRHGAKGAQGKIQFVLRLRPLHRQIHRILLRLRIPSHYGSGHGRQGRLCAYDTGNRYVQKLFFLNFKTKGGDRRGRESKGG